MIHFHPDENILAEYASGSLDWGLAISVKAHLSMCPECQNKVSALSALGADFMHAASDHETNDEVDEKKSFKALMQKIRERENADTSVEDIQTVAAQKTQRARNDLPPIVQRLIENEDRLNWSFLSPSLKQARLTSGQDKFEVCLHRIRKGGKVAEHDHRGREVTVILEGAFSDEDGTYRKGDFLLKEPGDKHRPTATQDQDCLCLSIVEAPVKLTGVMGKVINPFLRFSPS